MPLVLCAEESAVAEPPACAVLPVGPTPLLTGAREITGIAFIPIEIASHVPSAGIHTGVLPFKHA